MDGFMDDGQGPADDSGETFWDMWQTDIHTERDRDRDRNREMKERDEREKVKIEGERKTEREREKIWKQRFE